MNGDNLLAYIKYMFHDIVIKVTYFTILVLLTAVG